MAKRRSDTELREAAEKSVDGDLSKKDVTWVLTDVHEQHEKSYDQGNANKEADPSLMHDSTELLLHAFKRAASLVGIVVLENRKLQKQVTKLTCIILALTVFLAFVSCIQLVYAILSYHCPGKP